MASDLDPAERPINQHWSWDRILRSCFIKQADVLQGIFVFEDQYDLETVERNRIDAHQVLAAVVAPHDGAQLEDPTTEVSQRLTGGVY